MEIGLGMVALMAENHRTQLESNTFVRNAEIGKAMALVRFQYNE